MYFLYQIVNSGLKIIIFILITILFLSVTTLIYINNNIKSLKRNKKYNKYPDYIWNLMLCFNYLFIVILLIVIYILFRFI